MQKSTSFLLPLTGLKYSDLKESGFITSYIGDHTKYADEEWGNHIYLLFSKDSDLTYAKSSPKYIEDYEVEDGWMVKYSLTNKEKADIVNPFCKGAYSKIDRAYVNSYFSSVTMTSEGLAPSLNYMILNKAESLRQSIEDHLGVELEDDAEVWSRPEKEDEIYNYKSNNNELSK